MIIFIDFYSNGVIILTIIKLFDLFKTNLFGSSCLIIDINL